MRHLVLGAGAIALQLSGAGAAFAAVHHHRVTHTRTHGSGGASYVAGAHCAPTVTDQQAFEVSGLKSELMVTALSCNEQDRYNAFVAKFHPDLIAEEGVLNSYFSRAYGRSAQTAHDDYITQLANVQAEGGLKAGVAFCEQRGSMFDEVSALDNARDLSDYAQGKDIVQPASFTTCSAPSEPVRAVHIRRISARTTTHHHHAE